MRPTLDETGRLVPREDYRLATLNCGGEDFAVACMRSNLRYEKNQKREDVKSHHYIISFDPRDGTDNGLTVDRAQELGEKFCKEHFPGHQALVCTHPDGHNHSGNKIIRQTALYNSNRIMRKGVLRMELIASLFCHVSESIPEAEIQRELQRQHDILAQNAASSGRTIEHCFFHVGEFNLEDPDQVLLRFLQRAQADDLGLVLVESKDLFPLSQQAHIPCMEVCFVREGVQEILGNKDVQVAEEDLRPKNVYMYWGF